MIKIYNKKIKKYSANRKVDNLSISINTANTDRKINNSNIGINISIISKDRKIKNLNPSISIVNRDEGVDNKSIETVQKSRQTRHKNKTRNNNSKK